jgi:hypothetical protein
VSVRQSMRTHSITGCRAVKCFNVAVVEIHETSHPHQCGNNGASAYGMPALTERK